MHTQVIGFKVELPKRHIKASAFFLVALFLMDFPAIFCLAANSGVEDIGMKNVNVYVICLNRVNAIGVGNISRVFEGVLLASKVEEIHYWTGEEEPVGATFMRVMGVIPINVSVALVTDWTAYRVIVEYAHDVVLVNAHGETLPVPDGYDREEWVDRIADAMLNRNVTWVHVAGYPFYYYWNQKTGEGDWGEEGFKRLMSHIGKNNVTCWPLDYSGVETDTFGLNPSAQQSIWLDWSEFYHVFRVSWGHPLKNLEFKDLWVAPPTHGSYVGGGYLPSAVIKFADEDERVHDNFGFYVHFGAGQTYDPDGEKSDRDFYGSYSATALALRAYVMKLSSLEAIRYGEVAIAEARAEGRVKGLDEAVSLLKESKEDYLLNNYDSAMMKICTAQKAAEEAINPSFLESYGLFLGSLVILIMGVSMGTGFGLKWRNNRQKKVNSRHEPNEKT